MNCRKVKPFLFLVLATVLSVGTVRAQESVQSTPLTDSRIKGFCAAMTDLVEWAEDHRERLAADEWEADALEGEKIQQYLSSLSTMYGRSGDAESEFATIVKRHGFESTLDWEETSGRIVHAWAAITINENKDAINSGLTSGIPEALLSSLSAEQRKQMEDAIAQVKTEIEELDSDVPPADVAAVTRNRELLNEFFGVFSKQE